MHDDRRIVEDRVRALLDRVILPALYRDPRPLCVDGEPVPVARALAAEYGPFAVGAT
ncbi:hypothetical protein AB0D49_26495 [Streptomyces sp. NPDC048290]|uniref:hypothetical protein n=1 Tax=Streptomyces sp. NPDC048290 TaxID=3155811 RepID=UPI00341A7833